MLEVLPISCHTGWVDRLVDNTLLQTRPVHMYTVFQKSNNKNNNINFDIRILFKTK